MKGGICNGVRCFEFPTWKMRLNNFKPVCNPFYCLSDFVGLSTNPRALTKTKHYFRFNFWFRELVQTANCPTVFQVFDRIVVNMGPNRFSNIIYSTTYRD